MDHREAAVGRGGGPGWGRRHPASGRSAMTSTCGVLVGGVDAAPMPSLCYEPHDDGARASFAADQGGGNLGSGGAHWRHQRWDDGQKTTTMIRSVSSRAPAPRTRCRAR
jgi:hypothetical protein